MGNEAPEKIVVTIDPDLEDLVAGYLENRRKDVASLKTAQGKGDFETSRIPGHSMKGSGGGYGFDRITELGAALEQASKEQNAAALTALTDELSDYLARLEVVYG